MNARVNPDAVPRLAEGQTQMIGREMVSRALGPVRRARRRGMFVTFVALLPNVGGCGKVSFDVPEASGGGSGGATAADVGGRAPVAGASGIPSGGANTTGAPPTGVLDVGACDTSLAPARISYLTSPQWENVVRDVFGLAFAPDSLIPKGLWHIIPGSNVDASGENKVEIYDYLLAADAVAARLSPCGTAAPDAACVEAFLRSKLPLAWRRPVTDAEVLGLVSVFEQGRQFQPAYGVKALTRAMLLSGSFMFRSELGADATATSGSSTLSSYELASAVSFAFLDSVPDPELWAKAVDGSLGKPAVLAAQADRLLQSKAVQDNLRKKVSYFLNIERLLDPRSFAFSNVPANVQPSLYEGGQRFLDQVLWHGHFSDLFLSQQLFVDKAAAKFYGLPQVAGDGFTGLGVTDGTRNAGILSQPSFLAGANLVQRGLSVYRSFVCGPTLGPPVAEEGPVVQGLTWNTERDLFRQVDKLSCGSCHLSFDSLGYALESYDQDGRFQSNDPFTNAPIDTSSVIQGFGPDFDGPLANVSELAARLATGRRASDCVAPQLTRIVVGREPANGDACFRKVKDELAASGSFSSFFKAIVTSPAFLTRDLGGN